MSGQAWQRDGWASDANAALLTDLYQLTMLQAYFAEDMRETAVFDLFVRRLPKSRNYLIACGLDDALRYLEHLSFGRDALDALASLGRFSPALLDQLSRLRFTGDVFAVPEGTVVFAGEPIIEVVAPLPEAQLAESFVLNQIHFATLAASKAARVVSAARGRTVVDFGMRRMHGADAAMKAARAFYIAGVDATSNVLAGLTYGLPVRGTMAHSYILAHDDELAAFRAFTHEFPQTTLLVDTYDTLAGVEHVIELARELAADFRVHAIRLDSGDLDALSRQARRMLDRAGLGQVTLFASSGLDEYSIDELIRAGAPIDGFGVGTQMGVSADAPSLDSAYKLVAYAGRGRVKLSAAKSNLPERKQVFRLLEGGRAVRDVIALHDESVAAAPGASSEARPLLVPVMRRGQRLPAGRTDLEMARARAASQLEELPAGIRDLGPADPPYLVAVSASLAAARDKGRRRLNTTPSS